MPPPTTETRSQHAHGTVEDTHLDFHQRTPVNASPKATQHTTSYQTRQGRSIPLTLGRSEGEASQQSCSHSQGGAAKKRSADEMEIDRRPEKRTRREVIDMTDDDEKIIIKVEPVDFSLPEEEVHDVAYWRREAEAYEEESIEKAFQLLMLRRQNADLIREIGRLRVELENARSGGRSLGS